MATRLYRSPLHRVAHIALLALLSTAATAASASERAELLELRHGVLNLIDGLVDAHLLSSEQAENLKTNAFAKAKRQAAQDLADEAASAAPLAGAEVASAEPRADGQRVVRVPYVPEFVKQEIRQDVKADLKREVMADVSSKAREEKWGTPDALPAWVNRLRWSGDLRLRFQYDQFASRNQPRSYIDYAAVNAAGGLNSPNTFLNLSEDREALRARLRLALAAQLTDKLDLGLQFATGRADSPVSTNQTLGTNFDRYAVALDHVFLRYSGKDSHGDERYGLIGGKFANPFLATPLLWDPDLSFDGAAATLAHRFGWRDLAGTHERNVTLSASVGGFAVAQSESAENDGSSNDKWLLAAQLVLGHAFAADVRYEIGLALYDYVNEIGRFDPAGALGSVRYDWTTPGFLQRGNTLFTTRLDAQGRSVRFGLASNYQTLDALARIRFTQFDPVVVTFTADALRNLAWDQSAVRSRVGPGAKVHHARDGFSLQLDIGWAALETFGAWNLSAAYRYLERDAVLDAFTDSEFALGGTDAQGFILSGEMALSSATSIALRYMSSHEIDLAPLSIDILQVDLNARF